MITKAVQIQLQHIQAPKWRPSSLLAEVAENCSNSAMGSMWVEEGGGRSLPSANPDNVAAGGATDARCGEGGELEGGEEGWHGIYNSP
jgi:hypothetical protein